jgi:predicted GIY-YIG superfamily endonuclease
MDDYVVYLLYNDKNNYTYIGITNNIERRLRQHNKIIKGGARYTSCKKGEGTWLYYLHITNLNKSKALSIEKTIKNKCFSYKKKLSNKDYINSLQIRLDVIESLNIDKDSLYFF